MVILLVLLGFLGSVQAAEGMSPIFSSPKSCKAIVFGNYGLCDNDDCRGILMDTASRCQTQDCRAIVYSNHTLCQSRDCKALIFKISSYCTTRICRAILYDNAGMCQANHAVLPWTKHLNVIGRGSTKLQADYDARRQFDSEARWHESRCRQEGGSPFSRTDYPRCREIGHRWQCDLSGTVYCRQS